MNTLETTKLVCPMCDRESEHTSGEQRTEPQPGCAYMQRFWQCGSCGEQWINDDMAKANERDFIAAGGKVG